MNDHYFKITYHVPVALAEEFEALLSEELLEQAVIEDYRDVLDAVHGDIDALPDDYQRYSGIVRISFFFEEESSANSCVKELRGRAVRFNAEVVRETVSTSLFPLTTDIGSQFTVVYAENSHSYTGDRVPIILTTSQIFGTGTHPTTRLMTDMMERFIVKGSIVVDAGAGSLILSLIAVKLGAQKVMAFDIADNFLLVAHDVAGLNGCDNLLPVQGDQFAFMRQCPEWNTADIILINMLPQETIPVLRSFVPFVNVGTYFLLSGFIASKEDEYQPVFRDLGLHILHREERAGWLAFVVKK